MWPHALGANDGLQTIAVFTVNVVGLALLVVATAAYVHAYGQPRVPDWMGRLAQRARHTVRTRSRRLVVLGQKAFLRCADLLAGVLTDLTEAIARAVERAEASTRHRDPRLG